MPISYTKRDWTNNSPPAINAANLGAMDGTDVAFIDNSNDSLRTYRFGFALATPYHP